jgi:hypothetical protein
MSGRSTNVGHIDFSGWLFRLLTWDGVLPIGIILVPFVIGAIFPNHEGAIVIAAVALPIVAFFVRIAVGCRHIDENNCGPIFQRVQVWLLLFGIFVLVFIDAMLMISHVMPRGALLATKEDQIAATIAVSLYLAPMIVAMYPGRAKPLPEVFNPADG